MRHSKWKTWPQGVEWTDSGWIPVNTSPHIEQDANILTWKKNQC